MQGLIGKKKGMTQIWDEAGNRVAVTVIVSPALTVSPSSSANSCVVWHGFTPAFAKCITCAFDRRCV